MTRNGWSETSSIGARRSGLSRTRSPICTMAQESPSRCSRRQTAMLASSNDADRSGFRLRERPGLEEIKEDHSELRLARLGGMDPIALVLVGEPCQAIA